MMLAQNNKEDPTQGNKPNFKEKKMFEQDYTFDNDFNELLDNIGNDDIFDNHLFNDAMLSNISEEDTEISMEF
jgi:hypothetical protein